MLISFVELLCGVYVVSSGLLALGLCLSVMYRLLARIAANHTRAVFYSTVVATTVVTVSVFVALPRRAAIYLHRLADSYGHAPFYVAAIPIAVFSGALVVAVVAGAKAITNKNAEVKKAI